MTTAVYRGVKYNVEERRVNQLVRIREQLEKAEALKKAQVQACCSK